MHSTGTVFDMFDSATGKLVVIFVFVLAIVLINAIAGVIKSLSRERSRREIAAYIAEGSIPAKDGERLMKADPEE